VKTKDDAKNIGEIFAEVESEDLIRYGLIPILVADFFARLVALPRQSCLQLTLIKPVAHLHQRHPG
jgi:ATP-dependent Clp protease ATP-binding subunit ClpX